MSENKTTGRSIFQIIGLTLMLVVLPLGSWYYLSQGFAYQKRTLAELERYQKLSYFSHSNQYGKKISLEDVQKNIFVAGFTKMDSPENKNLIHQMKRVYEQFDHRSDILFLLHTLDNDADTLKLQAFSKQYEFGDRTQCHILANPSDGIQKQLQKVYQMPTGPKEESEPLTLSNNFSTDDPYNYFVLVDSSTMIRNYYLASDSIQVNKLVEHIAMIMPRLKKSFKQKRK